ncbi:MAG: lamin tail domain-containing protein [Verrucomicrobiales bacterium]|nr:lamin tail domain-containing protein [Verrucomicrobiales bacterium]
MNFPALFISIYGVFLLTLGNASGDVVINEIHYNPPENTVREEFIEIYNTDSVAIDLGGWRISGAVDYHFPAGISIAGGDFLVIAEDPSTLLKTLNVTALGPYSGNLDSEGETIRLRDASDQIVDKVDYKVGFPWPVASNGGGASIELVNAALDNSLGSSWRASMPQNLLSEAILLPFADDGWSWRPGTTEASEPVDAWRTPGFIEDGTWLKAARAPFGFGRVNGVTLNTVIDGMRGNYNCLFLRKDFTVAADEMPSQLVINYTVDDGMLVWINGVEVERFRFSAVEQPGIDSLATGQGGEGQVLKKTIVNPASFLVEGTNTIAVQVFNASPSSSDLGFDISLVRAAQEDIPPTPSPGSRNVAFSRNPAPNIRKVSHFPQQPASDDVVVITAKVSDPEGVESVKLEYQPVDPGSYIPSKLPLPVSGGNINLSLERPDNDEYEQGWVSLGMSDNGLNGDSVPGDGIYSVSLPPHGHRFLVRYRITVSDSEGVSARVPYADDPSLNFAYFVYDGIPDYNGHSSATLESLPVYHLITRAGDYTECLAYSSSQISQGNDARFFYNWNAAIVYDGVVYDNIRYRLRGANGRYHKAGKRSMRLRFNDGHYFQARDQVGKKYPKKWRTLTTGKGFDNRSTLTYGLNEAVTMYLFNKIGVPGCNTHWVHWRVIDDEQEAPDRWRGDFHGLNFVLETYDVRFLEAHDMEKGNLYKLINQTTDWRRQQRYQAAFAPDDGSDHSTIEAQLDGGDSADYIRAHVNMHKWNRWHALAEAIRLYDFWPSANKNMVYYFEPDYTPENNSKGKLWILPWDTDASWGPTWNSGHDVVYNALFPAGGGGSDGNSTPELWPEYFNEVRQLRDLLWQEDQLMPLIDAFAMTIEPFEAADSDRWKGAPPDAGNYGGLGGAGSASLANLVQDMKNFAFSGGSWPGGSVGVGGRGAHLDSLQASNGEGSRIPVTPTLNYTGPAGFPVNGLRFESSTFSDPQGEATFAAMEWRVAEISPPGSGGGELVPFFTTGSEWRYLDDGSNQGSAWQQPDFDDSAWLRGASPFGYADNQVVTPISFGPDSGDKHITTYFRKKINIDALETLKSITLTLQRDDGAVIYVNGVEVARSQIPAGDFDFDTPASAARDEDTLFDFELSSSVFLEGENVLAVEVHQASAGSSDMIFDLRMNGITGSATGPESLKLEWDAQWESGEILEFDNRVDIPASVVRAGRLYRARVRHKDNTGRWSHWSSPVEFVATLPDITGLKSGLVVTELMYHPPSPGADEVAAGYDDDDFFEYIELKNVGDVPLDLRDLRFTKGIDFDFATADIISLPPGSIVLVVKDIGAFEMRYGEGLPVAGQWQVSDRLDNGGERVKLSFGAGEAIRDFTYDDVFPWPAAPDGSGFSLTLRSPELVPDHSVAGNWSASSTLSGTPGMDDSGGASGYHAWREALFGPGNPAGSSQLDDPDGDGVVNIMEYAAGSNAKDGGSVPSMAVSTLVEDNQDFLAVTYTRRVDRPDINWRVECSVDFVEWQSGPGITATVLPRVFNADGTETVREICLLPIKESIGQYLRVVIEFSP